jgi:hypothetical protein
MHVGSPDRLDALVRIARRLLALGANPNAEYHWNWHPELPRTALWGSVCAVGHLPLAEALLDAGANPTDGVTAHIAGGGGNLPALELLHRYDLDVNGIPGGVPPLVYMMGWSDNPEGPAWLLDHGATDELSALERFIAACARADRGAADAILAAHPGLRSGLGPEHHLMLHRPAESGNAAVLETMLGCGFNPEAKDKDNVTPLHRAAMGGHVEAVRVLLTYGADVNAQDGMFSASPLVWAVEGRGSAKRRGADHVGVARLLIASGSPLDWTPPEGAPGPERTLEGLIELRRDAEHHRIAAPIEPM